MKTNLLIIVLILSSSAAFAQRAIAVKPEVISKSLFENHLPAVSNIEPAKADHKSKGIIRIKASACTIVLKDDGEMKEYRYEGELKGGQLIVIHELEPNTEEYYLINKKTGRIDTLLNRPTFYTDNKMLICADGAGTDVHQRIQVAKLDGTHVKTLYYIQLKVDDAQLDHVYWYNATTIFINFGNKFYRLSLK